jgi:lipopolysaccharide/colanic/teichoic acid biosynthesis glycosyltransferase
MSGVSRTADKRGMFWIATMKQAGLLLFTKTLIDRTIAAGVLVATSPLLGAAALAVLVDMGRPVLFTQVRPGKHGKPFRLYKMRTMSNARTPDGELLPDAERLTNVGRFLRATSIDDLPNLINVIRGELSLVGPRPLLMSYLRLYTKEQARRHDVLPGITGWAQINGRNTDSHEEKFRLDVWYVDHWSPWLDIRILARTVLAVARREGVSADGQATMGVWRAEHASFDDHTKTLATDLP